MISIVFFGRGRESVGVFFSSFGYKAIGWIELVKKGNSTRQSYTGKR